MDHNPSEPRRPSDRSEPSSSPETGAREDEDTQKHSPYPEGNLLGGDWPRKPNDPQHDYGEWSLAPQTKPLPPQSAFSKWGLPIGLFLLTVFTTLWAGAYNLNTKPVSGAWDFLTKYPNTLYRGLPFAGTLLGILVTHEFGHYIFSRIHRVPASFPLFIPGPPHFIGTFGAIIRMRSPIMNRRALFDIGVAGPIAGFVVAVVAMIVGLSLSEAAPQAHTFGIKYGDPLLLQFLVWSTFGSLPDHYSIFLHPVAEAAWFGFFVTALNLIPLGQLDGGHVAFAVFGHRQRTLALTIIPVLLILGVTGWPGWIVWAGLAGLVGVGHPPVVDPQAALGKKRMWVAWGALAIFVVSFAPVPFYFG